MEKVREYKEKKGARILRIFQDEDAQSPREWDNVGKMLCFHKRYNLGDKTDLKSGDFEGWDEIGEHLIKEEGAILILPLFLYDHSGLAIKIGDFHGLLPQGHAEFDSGQVGFIYVDKETLKKEGVSKKKAGEILRGEVETYNQYLQGDVYGYKLIKVKRCSKCKRDEEEIIDSCWGYYGLDSVLGEAGIDLKNFEEVEG